MRGIVLAGGKGTRLSPLTISVNKHLLPVYDQPLINWPVMTLVRIGISEILIVSNEDDIPRYQRLFGDGSALGVSMSYAAQPEADGIGGALKVAHDFAAQESVAVILGDNIFIDASEIRDALSEFRAGGESGAAVFLKQVPDPQRFGVAKIHGDRVVSIEEKPKVPPSDLAVTGLYFFDRDVFSIVGSQVPSARGELEITDVNNAYIARGALRFHTLKTEWIDAGTHESLFKANLVAAGMDYGANKKIKILFGINKLSVGGAEHLILHQMARINRDRYDPYLVTLLPSGAPNLDSEAAYLGDHWKRFSFIGLADIVSLWKLYRYLRRERFDVVISSLFFTCTLLRLAAYLARVPVIFSNEVNVDDGSKGRHVWAERILARVTTMFIANSKEVYASVSRRLRLPQGKVALIYSGIDLKGHDYSLGTDKIQALRAKHGCALRETGEIGEIVIATAGSLTEQKGQRYLIDAFARLRTQVSVPVRLIIFGEGGLRSELSSQAKAAGLESSIELPGVAPLEEIIAVTDIFTLPSLWEGMSLMLLEAMAGKKPIVATDVSGSRELIEDNENGFLVPPKDPEALAQKLRILIQDPDLRERFGRASVKEVQKFSVESNLNNLYALINESMRRAAR